MIKPWISLQKRYRNNNFKRNKVILLFVCFFGLNVVPFRRFQLLKFVADSWGWSTVFQINRTNELGQNIVGIFFLNRGGLLYSFYLIPWSSYEFSKKYFEVFFEIFGYLTKTAWSTEPIHHWTWWMEFQVGHARDGIYAAIGPFLHR